MDAKGLRAVRVEKGWSQVEAAHRLGVSQPYLAMLERGQRRLTSELTRRAVQVYGVPPTAVSPSQSAPLRSPLAGAALARDLAGLGYPALAYLRPRQWKPKNPGEVLLAALAQDDLESRLVEALPWLGLRYSLDWTWVVREAKVHDLQNRLGFVVSLTRGLAHRAGDRRKVESLADLERTLERSRLAREDTLCRASMPEAERRWLTEHRPAEAKRWNLLTDWTAEVVRYVA